MASLTWSIIALLVIAGAIDLVTGCNYGLSVRCPGKSCSDIYQKNPKSHGIYRRYVIKAGSIGRYVYCDMSLECGGKKGWLKVAKINVAGGSSCPHGWKMITSPVAACRAPSDNAGCYSVPFTTFDLPYSRVCGMVVGYQKGTTDGFLSHVRKTSINDPYLDGVSITYSAPRKHIWSYAAGLSEHYSRNQGATCPCSLHGGARPPSFVHDHYYCESGSTYNGLSHRAFYTHDPLWDGRGCTGSNSCCAQPSLPWFYRQLPQTTNEKLEVRICSDQPYADEAVLVKEIQLYMQ